MKIGNRRGEISLTKTTEKLTKKATRNISKKPRKKTVSKKISKLTLREKKFCLNLVENGDFEGSKERAARAAGYSEKTARVTAYKLLKKNTVQKEIERLHEKVENTCIVTKDYVLTGLKEVAERCMQRKPVMVFNYKNKEMEQKMEGGEGVWEFDSRGACKAFELLGRHLAMFTDKHLVGDKDDPAFRNAFFGVSV